MKTMLDTIVITIDFPRFIVQDDSKFKPSTFDLFSGVPSSYFYRKFVNNPTSTDYKNKIYKPRLTIYERINRNGKQEIKLRIEFSAPKLIYGNNIDEVEEKDFKQIISTLKERLSLCGVVTSKDAIINAIVPVVHFSKNIALDDYSTPTMIIRDLGKIDLTKRLELNRTHFRNEGHALYFDANNHSIILYDKIADIIKPKRKAVDKDKTLVQLELFEQYKKLKKPNEILKFEIRLTHQQKLCSVLQKMGFYKELTFKNIFNEQLAKKTINYYWQEYFVKQSHILRYLDKEPEKMLQQIIKSAKKRISTKNALALLGFMLTAQANGTRSLREIIENNYTTRSWYRLRDWFNACLKRDKSEQVFYIKTISEELKKFKPIKAFELHLLKGYNGSDYEKK